MESWIWANTKEEDHADIRRELERDIHLQWAPSPSIVAGEVGVEPSRWQENKPGESLLSAHR